MQDEDLRTWDEGTLKDLKGAMRARRNRHGRGLRIAGLVLIGIALVLGGYVWWLLWGTGLTTRAAQQDLRPRFEASVGTRDVREAPSRERVVKVPGGAIAILKIPKIDVDMVVVEGTDTESLKRGPGHYTQTAYPWEDTGRVGIAGHRTTYGAPFWSLNELREGDRIVLATEYGTFEYRVSRTLIIAPSNGAVLEPTNQPTLVLTTCNPRFSAAERLVVFAQRVD